LGLDIPIASQVRTVVFTGDPQDVGPVFISSLAGNDGQQEDAKKNSPNPIWVLEHALAFSHQDSFSSSDLNQTPGRPHIHGTRQYPCLYPSLRRISKKSLCLEAIEQVCPCRFVQSLNPYQTFPFIPTPQKTIQNIDLHFFTIQDCAGSILTAMPSDGFLTKFVVSEKK
jgi:hypothetical protein